MPSKHISVSVQALICLSHVKSKIWHFHSQYCSFRGMVNLWGSPRAIGPYREKELNQKIKAGDAEIKQVRSAKLLGITMDDDKKSLSHYDSTSLSLKGLNKSHFFSFHFIELCGRHGLYKVKIPIPIQSWGLDGPA